MGTEDILICLVALALVFLIFFVGKWKEKNQPSHRLPPALPSLPIIGSLPFLRGFDHIPKFFTEKSRELGPIFTFRVGSRFDSITNDPIYLSVNTTVSILKIKMCGEVVKIRVKINNNK